MKHTPRRSFGRLFLLALFGVVLLPHAALAQDVSDEMFAVNNTWMLVATFLVFIMHLGFACLESGLTQAKNAVNILFKNTGVVSIGLVTYAFVGFNLMYPGDFSLGQFFGFAGFGIDAGAEGVTSAYNPGYTYWTDFIFQAMFAATAATIVSGAVAERIKLNSFLIFTTIYMGFYDFAGSTLVHSVGGWGALAGIIILGPRLGKYGAHAKPIAGHSMPLATIGVFLLWLGWFGFNGGSVLSADPGLVSLVFVTTSLAAAAGVIGAMLTSCALHRSAKLDDPVGAVSVHLVCGIWGTLAVGIFSADHSFVTQLIGVLAYGAFTFAAALLIFFALHKSLGLRVSEEEERMGLDVGEHGMEPTAGSRSRTRRR
ncbi:Putative ammonium transporter sll0108 [Geodia barretti]|uniref:Ammonium transporter sll0108 n=1 Tax=Geodia barretti TaxID=519541 RepID=A0AA35RPL4_GEOBA|nr:Putative ammonium transporter sll0108 [Geodia barretti]